ncbi:hypothetical protein ACROYT_G037361 [Oculina patagonica]
MGFIKISDICLSTVEGLTGNFQAGVEAEFVVCPNEELTSELQHKFHVEVLVEPAEKVDSLIVCKKEDGNFQVKFIPKVPGSYNITVKINGDKLANSPFTVQVKERRLDVVGELDLKGEIPQNPHGIAVNSKGLIAVADRETNCILVFDNEGMFVRKFGWYGEKAAGRLNRPKGITYLNDDEILVADELNNCIQQFNVQTGNFVKSFGKHGAGEGETDFNNNRIQGLTKDGKPVFKFGDSGVGKLNNPTGCICYKNMFIASDSFNHCLKVFDGSGKFLYKIGEAGKADGQLYYPWGLCVEKYGNRVRIFLYVTMTMVAFNSLQWKVVLLAKLLLR